MDWAEALWWLPTAAVVVLAALAFAAAIAPGPRPGRGRWAAATLVIGALGIAVTVWQQERSHAELHGEGARLQELGTRLDELGHMLPVGPGKTPGETFDTVAAAIKSLNAKTKDLQEQIQALQERNRGRTIDPKRVSELADALKPFGSHRVVVSCVPDDVEAFNYANEIANVLRAAGWDAVGPERTTIFGEDASMAVRLFVHGGTAPPETAKILTEAFTRFNIAYQPGLTPSEAIPDPQTVELFVSHKP